MVESWKRLFGTVGVASTLMALGGVGLMIGGTAAGSPLVGAVGLGSALVATIAFGAAGLRSVIYGQWTMQRFVATRFEKADVKSLGQQDALASLQRSVNRDLKTGHRIVRILEGTQPQYGNATNTASHYRGVGPDYALAERSYLSKPNLGTFALQTGSMAMRDVLALAATGMEYRADDLLSLVRVWQGQLVETKTILPLAESFDRKGLLVLASVIAHQQTTPLDQQDATYLFRLAKRLWGTKHFSRTERFLALEVETQLADPSSVLKIARGYGLGREWQQIRLIRANGALEGLVASDEVSVEDLSAWEESTNEVFAAADLQQITVTGGPFPLQDLLNHLAPDANVETAQVDDGPLVSVLIPTFEPNYNLFSAVLSLLEQTFRNIEIIVIDDGSGIEYSAVLDEVEALSDKVRVHRESENRGAYAARNVGLGLSNGEFITVHDDDDWSHPQKIEKQLAHLQKHPEIPANMSSHVRVSPDGRFIRINANPILTQPNYSSLMFRRTLVDQIGGWQETRRGADSEFKERIDAAWGPNKVPVLTRAPLSFTRAALGNLTSGEIQRGYISGDRRWFGLIHKHLHSEALSDQKDLRSLSEIHPATPLRMLSTPPRDSQYDVIYCTDFRFPGGTTALAIAELKLLVARGYRVGLLQLDSPVNAPWVPIAPRVIEFLEENQEVSVLALNDKAKADLLIVRQPGIVEYADSMISEIRANKGALIANTTPVFAGGENVAFDLPRCKANFSRLFGVEPKIYPESPVTRSLIEKLGYGPLLDKDIDWVGMAPSQFRPKAKSRAFSTRPLIGRHGRDHRDKWPDTVEILGQTFFNPSSYDTAILGGIAEIPYPVPHEYLEAAEIIDFGEKDPVEFLQDLDFFVHYPSSNWKESFGMATVEALATGVVCILPPYMETVFGDAAVYAEPEQVEDVIASIWKSPVEYREQVEKGLAFVEKNFRGRHVVEILEED